jgi:hypothetical protein
MELPFVLMLKKLEYEEAESMFAMIVAPAPVPAPVTTHWSYQINVLMPHVPTHLPCYAQSFAPLRTLFGRCGSCLLHNPVENIHKLGCR